MLGLKLNHVSKRGPWKQRSNRIQLTHWGLNIFLSALVQLMGFSADGKKLWHKRWPRWKQFTGSESYFHGALFLWYLCTVSNSWTSCFSYDMDFWFRLQKILLVDVTTVGSNIFKTTVISEWVKFRTIIGYLILFLHDHYYLLCDISSDQNMPACYIIRNFWRIE